MPNAKSIGAYLYSSLRVRTVTKGTTRRKRPLSPWCVHINNPNQLYLLHQWSCLLSPMQKLGRDPFASECYLEKPKWDTMLSREQIHLRKYNYIMKLKCEKKYVCTSVSWYSWTIQHYRHHLQSKWPWKHSRNCLPVDPNTSRRKHHTPLI